MIAAVARVSTFVAVLSTGLALVVTSGEPDISQSGRADDPPPVAVAPPEVDHGRLHPGDFNGSLSGREIRELIASGKVPDVTGAMDEALVEGSGLRTSDVATPPADADLATSQPADGGELMTLAAGSSSSRLTYSIDGTIYDVGQGTSGSLPGAVYDAAFAGDGTRAIVEYYDPQWDSIILLGAPWRRASVGAKSLVNGYAAPLSFDAEGRAVPALLNSVSPNGRWVAFTGPDMDLMYADPDNLGKVYLFDTTTLAVTEIPLENFGSTEEYRFVPTSPPSPTTEQSSPGVAVASLSSGLTRVRTPSPDQRSSPPTVRASCTKAQISGCTRPAALAGLGPWCQLISTAIPSR